MLSRSSLMVATLLGLAVIALVVVPGAGASASATGSASGLRSADPATTAAARASVRARATAPTALRSAAGGCGPAPQGQVAVVVVVDRGSGTPAARCAVVPERSTGLDAMRAAGLSVRLDGGFVCAIDGLPATGCGNRSDAGTAYWRYWHALGGTWTYSQVGAGGYRLPVRCAVEGWVWSDAATADTPPRLAAPRPTCDATPPPTAPPSTARPPVSPPVAGGGAAAPPPTTRVPSVGSPSGVPAGPPTPRADGGTSQPGSTALPEVAGASTVAPDQPATPVPDGDDRSGDIGSERSNGDASERADDRADPGDELASAPLAGEGSAAPPWGVLVGIVLIAGLGGAAVTRSRARSRNPGAEAT